MGDAARVSDAGLWRRHHCQVPAAGSGSARLAAGSFHGAFASCPILCSDCVLAPQSPECKLGLRVSRGHVQLAAALLLSVLPRADAKQDPLQRCLGALCEHGPGVPLAITTGFAALDPATAFVDAAWHLQRARLLAALAAGAQGAGMSLADAEAMAAAVGVCATPVNEAFPSQGSTSSTTFLHAAVRGSSAWLVQVCPSSASAVTC